MAQEYDIKGMAERIRALKRIASEIKTMSGGIQAVDRNVDRILASIKMLEINVNDAVTLVDAN